MVSTLSIEYSRLAKKVENVLPCQPMTVVKGYLAFKCLLFPHVALPLQAKCLTETLCLLTELAWNKFSSFHRTFLELHL